MTRPRQALLQVVLAEEHYSIAGEEVRYSGSGMLFQAM